jgi:hypothetical protein
MDTNLFRPKAQMRQRNPEACISFNDTDARERCLVAAAPA